MMRTNGNVALRALLIVLALVSFGAAVAQAQTDVTVDPAAITFGYMNVFDLANNFQWGSGWGIGDLTAVYSGSILTLGPNTIGDPNEYWYQCVGGVTPPNCGGPGAPGNKIMEANLYAQVDGALAGQTVTFSGEVLSNTLTSAHTVLAFIKDFAPDFSSFVQTTVVLSSPGPFSLSQVAINDPARHVQWGFQTTGVNVWVTDLAPFGTLVVGPEGTVSSETMSWGTIKALY
ncbi:MAG: hypothetical protein IPI34_14735 [bacterium]|jgi:hypothetical protein|nr:hypothetical protein [bacterium]